MDFKQFPNKFFRWQDRMSSAKRISRSELWQATLDGNIEKIKEILEESKRHPDSLIFEFERPGKIMKHPLFLRASMAKNKNKYEVMNYLLEKGANINITTEDGTTALHHAVANDDKELVSYLLEKGADPEIVNNHALKPASLAISTNNTSMLQFLVDKGIDLNTPFSRYKVTYIYHAAKRGCLKCVQILLAAKSDVLVPQEDGKNMIQLAQEGKFSEDITKEILDPKLRRNRAFSRRRNLLTLLPGMRFNNTRRSSHRNSVRSSSGSKRSSSGSKRSSSRRNSK